jgi:hypothetical protein
VKHCFARGSLANAVRKLIHLYRVLRQVGLVTEYEGSAIKGTERKLKPKGEIHRKHNTSTRDSLNDCTCNCPEYWLSGLKICIQLLPHLIDGRVSRFCGLFRDHPVLKRED